MDVSSQLCRWCQSIFVGPLGPQQALPWDSISVDSWQYSTDAVAPLHRTEGESEYDDSKLNLPGDLNMDDNVFNHLSSGFKDFIGGAHLQCISEFESDLLKDFDVPSPPLPSDVGNDEMSSVWKRYGTHHSTASAFLKSVEDGCVICGSIRSVMPKAKDAFLVDASPFDTGFTTYGVYYFPHRGTCWVVFHLGLAPHHENIDLDTSNSILELLCRPLGCRCLPQVRYGIMADSNLGRFP